MKLHPGSANGYIKGYISITLFFYFYTPTISSKSQMNSPHLPARTIKGKLLRSSMSPRTPPAIFITTSIVKIDWIVKPFIVRKVYSSIPETNCSSLFSKIAECLGHSPFYPESPSLYTISPLMFSLETASDKSVKIAFKSKANYIASFLELRGMPSKWRSFRSMSYC